MAATGLPPPPSPAEGGLGGGGGGGSVTVRRRRRSAARDERACAPARRPWRAGGGGGSRAGRVRRVPTLLRGRHLAVVEGRGDGRICGGPRGRGLCAARGCQVPDRQLSPPSHDDAGSALLSSRGAECGALRRPTRGPPPPAPTIRLLPPAPRCCSAVTGGGGVGVARPDDVSRRVANTAAGRGERSASGSGWPCGHLPAAPASPGRGWPAAADPRCHGQAIPVLLDAVTRGGLVSARAGQRSAAGRERRVGGLLPPPG